MDYSATLVITPSPDDIKEGMVRIRWDSGTTSDVFKRDVTGIDQLPRRRRLKPQRLGYEGVCYRASPPPRHNLMVEEKILQLSEQFDISSSRRDEEVGKTLFGRFEEEVGTSSEFDDVEDSAMKTVRQTNKLQRRKRPEPSRLENRKKLTKQGKFYNANVEEDVSLSETDVDEERGPDLSETDEDERRASSPKNAPAVKNIPGIDPEEVDMALQNEWPKSRLQPAMARIYESRQNQMIYVGFRVRKFFLGVAYDGVVVGGPHSRSKEQSIDPANKWSVEYEDCDSEHMTYDDLMRWRVDRPELPATCRGRPLQMLEFFCGSAVVTQEFTQLKWKTDSIDVLEESNATIKKDILKLKYTDLRFVPDFIWASLPCETYSNAAGNRHRSTKTGNLEKSKKAREHNFIFLAMSKIMEWAKKKHTHLIVVIENPVGSLRKMPLMEEFTERFGLESTTVNYCAFGRDEMKPTMIWTNDYGLKNSLQEYTCEGRCQFGGRRGKHLLQVNHGTHDCSVIPQPLAEEVAEYINAKFVIDRIRKRKAASISNNEE